MKMMKNFSMFIYMLRHFPAFVFGELSFTMLNNLTAYIGNVVFLKYIVSAMMEGRPIYEMLFVLALFAVYQVAVDIYSSFYSNIANPKLIEKINKWFYYDIRNAVEYYELYVYDDPVFFDDMTYVSSHIVTEATATVSYISKIISNLINIALILSLFSQIGVVVLIIVCLSIILTVLLDIPIIRLNNAKKYDTNSIDRKKSYFFNCFFTRNSFAERKITGIGRILEDRYLESVEKQRQCNNKYGHKIFALSAIKGVLSSKLLLCFILFLYLLYETLITHNLHGSDFIASYNSVNLIVSSIMSMVTVWGKMKSSAYTIEKYNSVTASVKAKYLVATDNVELEKIHSIELKNVSFTYPGTEKRVLDRINMKLNLGDKVAIVGKNGSGKTTLVHLLMGLYKPTEGEILINGRVINKNESVSLRHQFAAFFQGMLPLEASIAENVALDTVADAERVRLALKKTGSTKLLDRRQDEIIGVRFDKHGLILSGGEFQKLMLSYCFYSNKDLIIMDEPSSALDPMAERDFNNQVERLSDGKLTVFVTHRLSTVHMANQIYVIDDGKLCDHGTHDELLKKDGVYKSMWGIQVEKYSM